MPGVISFMRKHIIFHASCRTFKEMLSLNKVVSGTMMKIASFLFKLSHFKTYTSSTCEKKNCCSLFQISLFVPEIFKFLKYAN